MDNNEKSDSNKSCDSNHECYSCDGTCKNYSIVRSGLRDWSDSSGSSNSSDSSFLSVSSEKSFFSISSDKSDNSYSSYSSDSCDSKYRSDSNQILATKFFCVCVCLSVCQAHGGPQWILKWGGLETSGERLTS